LVTHEAPATLYILAYLLFALVHQGAHMLGDPLCMSAQVLRSLASTMSNVLSGFATILRGIKNPRQCTDAESRQRSFWIHAESHLPS
jgi:hypothetical protein